MRRHFPLLVRIAVIGLGPAPNEHDLTLIQSDFICIDPIFRVTFPGTGREGLNLSFRKTQMKPHHLVNGIIFWGLCESDGSRDIFTVNYEIMCICFPVSLRSRKEGGSKPSHIANGSESD